MPTITAERTAFAPEADFDGLLAGHPELVSDLQEAYYARQGADMYLVSALALSVDAQEELRTPIRMFVAESNDARATDLWKEFDAAFSIKDDPELLQENVINYYTVAARKAVRLQRKLPEDYKHVSQDLIAAAPHLLKPYITAVNTRAGKTESTDVSAMIDEATEFLRQSKPVNAKEQPQSVHAPETSRSWARDCIAATLHAATGKMTKAQLKDWYDKTSAMFEPVLIGERQDYEFYPSDNSAPDPDAVIFAKAEALVNRLAATVERQDPKKLVATAAALIAIGTQISSLTGSAAHEKQQQPQAAQLISVERKAAGAMLSLDSKQNAVVHLGQAAKQSLETAASGKAVLPPSALTTAAEVTTAAAATQTPVTIEKVTTVQPVSQTPVAPALVVQAPKAQVPKLYDQFSQEHASTLLVAPQQLPAGGVELVGGKAVSAQVAEAAVNNDAASIIVTVDPAQPATVTAPTPEATTTTTAPETTVPVAVPSPANHDPKAETIFQGEYTLNSDILTKSGLSEQQLATALQAMYGEAMGRLAPGLYAMESKYGINALFAAAHAKIESAAGTSFFARTRNNYFGLGAYDSNPDAAFTFTDPAQCMDYYGRLLYNNYLFPGQPYFSGGTTIHNIFVHYSSSHDNEANPIAALMNEIKATALQTAPAPTTTVATTVPAPTTSTTVAAPTVAAPPTAQESTGTDTQWLDSWANQQAQTPPATLPESTTSSTTAPAVTTTTTPPAPSVVWPFPTKSADQIFPANTLSHIDQGLDIQEGAGEPVVAIADGTVTVGNPNPGGFGDDYPELTLDKSLGGPSNTVYYGHTHVAPSVVGKHVVAGEIIGYTNDGPDPSKMVTQNGSYAFPGWDEIGWAKDGTDAPVDSGGGATVAGQQMYNMLANAQPAATITQPPTS